MKLLNNQLLPLIIAIFVSLAKIETNFSEQLEVKNSVFAPRQNQTHLAKSNDTRRSILPNEMKKRNEQIKKLILFVFIV